MNKLSYLLLALLVSAASATAQTGSRPADATQTPNAVTNGPAPAAKSSVAATANPSAATPAATTEARAPAEENCACEDGVLPEVLASVNGVKITVRDFSPETRDYVARLQRQVVEARRRELDLQIDTILLEAEAKRREVSPRKVLEEEVIAKTQEPSEADAKAFYEENKARIGGDFAAVRNRIIEHLREQRQAEQARQLSERLRAAADVKVLVKAATPPTSPADRARLFATVNGRRITSAEIEDSLRPLVSRVREQVYNARRRELDLKINDTLLAQEAQKRQITPRALLDAEVEAKVPPVTETQASDFYNQNRERINGDFAQVKDKVIQYLKDAESRQLRVAFAERLRKGATVQTFLAAPAPPSSTSTQTTNRQEATPLPR